MVTEDYVSFEIAKLLKEKGFNVPTNYFYNNDGVVCHGCSSYNWNDEGEYDDGLQDYSRPLIWTVMKWLRFYNWSIVIEPKTFLANMVVNSWSYKIWADAELDVNMTESFKNYEEACEAAIKYCLENLI